MNKPHLHYHHSKNTIRYCYLITEGKDLCPSCDVNVIINISVLFLSYFAPFSDTTESTAFSAASKTESVTVDTTFKAFDVFSTNPPFLMVSIVSSYPFLICANPSFSNSFSCTILLKEDDNCPVMLKLSSMLFHKFHTNNVNSPKKSRTAAPIAFSF